jgi:hypothetical protein
MRRVAAPLTICLATGVLAGCGATDSTTEPSVSAAVTTSPTATGTLPRASSPTATPVLPCMPGQFEIAINDQQGAAGTIYATFEIRNASTDDCTENGFALMQMLSSNGGKIFTSWSNDKSLASPGPVDLPPGTEPLGTSGVTGHGFFLVWWSDASCTGSAANTPKSWSVTLPTSHFQAVVPAMDSSVVCGGAIKVGPVKPAPYT